MGPTERNSNREEARRQCSGRNRLENHAGAIAGGAKDKKGPGLVIKKNAAIAGL